MSFICLVIEKKEISQFSARFLTADIPILWLNTPLEYRRDPHSYEYYWTKTENKAWKKFRPVWDLNPWAPQYWCSALPTELTGQLGGGFYVDYK